MEKINQFSEISTTIPEGPFTKVVDFKFFGIKFWTIAYNGEKISNSMLSVFKDIDRAVQILNETYYLGRNSVIGR